MFDSPGISVDDLPWIQREEFVHYVELAYALGQPADWPRLRADLLAALTAAFGLDGGAMGPCGLTHGQQCALRVLDDVRRLHNPASSWPAFFESLWRQRHAIRPDLA